MSSEALKSWTTKAGLPGEIRQGYALCGYVGVTEGHPAFRKHYDQVDVDVHGGLTYGAEPNKDGVWWLGFDTAHAFDGPQHRTDEYVSGEVESLAEQLAKMSTPPSGEEKP